MRRISLKKEIFFCTLLCIQTGPKVPSGFFFFFWSIEFLSRVPLWLLVLLSLPLTCSPLILSPFLSLLFLSLSHSLRFDAHALPPSLSLTTEHSISLFPPPTHSLFPLPRAPSHLSPSLFSSLLPSLSPSPGLHTLSFSLSLSTEPNTLSLYLFTLSHSLSFFCPARRISLILSSSFFPLLLILLLLLFSVHPSPSFPPCIGTLGRALNPNPNPKTAPILFP